MHARAQRGSSLLLSMIVVLVVSAIGVALIRFSSRELAGSVASRQNEALIACAEAGRQVLMSQFRQLNSGGPTSITALNVPMDASGSSATVRAVGGHVDQVGVQQVTVLPPGTFGPRQSRGKTGDLTNIIGALGNTDIGDGNGTPYRIVVHCVDHGDATQQGGRQLEVEFGVQFGM